MIIYKDLVSGEQRCLSYIKVVIIDFTGAEVLTDSYPCVELFDGVLYEVTGKVCFDTNI